CLSTLRYLACRRGRGARRHGSLYPLRLCADAPKPVSPEFLAVDSGLCTDSVRYRQFFSVGPLDHAGKNSRCEFYRSTLAHLGKRPLHSGNHDRPDWFLVSPDPTMLSTMGFGVLAKKQSTPRSSVVHA